MQEYLVYVIAGISAIVLIVAGVLGGRLAWKRIVRGRAVDLIGRFEEISAGERQLRAVVTTLADAPDEEIVRFSLDPEHDERHALAYVASRMLSAADELMAVALPASLWSAADVLADAAWRVGREAERAATGKKPEEVLESLAGVDLLAVRDAVASAEAAVCELRERYGVEEAVVYGGGLYI